MKEKINYFDFKGSKGDDKPKSPVSTPDNLRSKDTVELVLGLGEGPMWGLEDGFKSFYIGDTALQNTNGDFNFKTFILNFFPGSDSAAPVIPLLGGQSNNNSVNQQLAYNVPVTRQTTTRGIQSIEVRLLWNALYVSNQSGTFNANASFRIEYKKTTSGTWLKAGGSDVTITGKTTSNYVKEIRIPLDADDTCDWDIRVTKLSPDSTEEYYNNMAWESFQEVLHTERAYNNTALIQISGEATDQFSSNPQWSGVYKGLIIKVPSNYNPETKTYDGIWDGSWQLAYCNNPAWCLYDFVTNERYGIKSYYPEMQLDKYDVYEAAQWCDELVSDGKGGTQPRYTFNCAISEPRSGKEAARYIAGSFNATFFDDLNGKSYLKVDKDDTAVDIFTTENISSEGFEYSYTDLNSRYNDLSVAFLNDEIDYTEDRRRVFDQVLIDKHGRIPYDFIAVGCTNAHEAVRRAWYKLITANTETCIVSFATNRRGRNLKPFDVILVADSEMGYGISGRIKTIAPSGTQINLRDPIYLESGVAYKISIPLTNGATFKADLTNVAPGYNTVLTLTSSVPEEAAEKASFSLESTTIGLPRPFRVTSIEEVSGKPDEMLIQGINLNRNKWYDSDNVVSSGEIQYSVLPNPFDPPGPIDCTFTEKFVRPLNEFQITVSPVFNRGAYKYYANDHSFEVWSRPANMPNEAFVKRELKFADTLVNHPAGLYEFKILGKSTFGKLTRLETAPTYTFNVTNPKDAPKDIDWLKLNKREIYWGYTDPPADFAGFEVRYHNDSGRTSWEDAIKPHQGLLSATSFYTQLIPPYATVIMVRAVDAFGIPSENSAIIYRDAQPVVITNEVDRIDFHPTWIGTKVGCAIDGTYLSATDTGTNLYSGVPTAEFYDGGVVYEATYNEMFYTTSFTVSSVGALIIEIDFEGAGYEAHYRPDGSTNWLPVVINQEVALGDYDLRIRVFGGPVRGKLKTLSVVIDAEDIIEDFEDLVIANASVGIRLPITKTYTTIKKVDVAIQGVGTPTAVGYRVIDKNPTTGPLIKLVDAAGAYCTGTLDATVKGFI